MAENRFKQALAGGGRLAGLWRQVPSPTVVEILAGAGASVATDVRLLVHRAGVFLKTARGG